MIARSRATQRPYKVTDMSTNAQKRRRKEARRRARGKPPTLASRIKRARSTLGMSQQDLSEYLEIPLDRIRRYERYPNAIYHRDDHHVLQAWCLMTGE